MVGMCTSKSQQYFSGNTEEHFKEPTHGARLCPAHRY